MNILIALHIILSLVIIGLIFTQSSSGLEDTNILSSSPPTRRGWDKITFNLTLIILLVFLASAIFQSIV